MPDAIVDFVDPVILKTTVVLVATISTPKTSTLNG